MHTLARRALTTSRKHSAGTYSWIADAVQTICGKGKAVRQGVAYLEDRHCITKGLVVQEPACFGKGHFTGQGRMLRSCQGFYAPVKPWHRARPLYDWRDEPRCCQDVTAANQRSLHITLAHDTGAWQGMHHSAGTQLAARVLHSSNNSLTDFQMAR